MEYKSGVATVDTDWTEIAPTFDIEMWSVYPTDGDVLVQMYDKNNWGDTIYGYSGIGMGDSYDCQKIRVKAVSTDVIIAYYMKNTI